MRHQSLSNIGTGDLACVVDRSDLRDPEHVQSSETCVELAFAQHMRLRDPVDTNAITAVERDNGRPLTLWSR